jgi:hypothetical protein
VYKSLNFVTVGCRSRGFSAPDQTSSVHVWELNACAVWSTQRYVICLAASSWNSTQELPQYKDGHSFCHLLVLFASIPPLKNAEQRTIEYFSCHELTLPC